MFVRVLVTVVPLPTAAALAPVPAPIPIAVTFLKINIPITAKPTTAPPEKTAVVTTIAYTEEISSSNIAIFYLTWAYCYINY